MTAFLKRMFCLFCFEIVVCIKAGHFLNVMGSGAESTRDLAAFRCPLLKKRGQLMNHGLAQAQGLGDKIPPRQGANRPVEEPKVFTKLC